MSGEEQSNAESKYEVREVIGKGAFGEVNLVVEKQSKQRFVLKRIKMARQSEWQRKATRQEIEIVSRLRHPFIMPYKEHWTHHGHTINVVYGYCEKGDLTTAITKQKGKFFPEETLRLWLAELLLAVDYMHRQNVLHRDIKTQNILLTGDGDVQIGDFGLSTVRVPSLSEMGQQQPGGDDTDPRMDSSPARFDVGDGGSSAAAAAAAVTGTPEPDRVGRHHALATAHVPANHAGAEAYTNGLANAHANGHNGPGDKDRDQLGHTPVHDPKAGTRNDYALVGTPHFMSPELLSSQKYSYETDIWSLGVVMYELTTLKPPFNAFNLAGLVAKIKRAALPPIPPCYSAEWTNILKSMLRKDPNRRAAPLELLAIPYMKEALQQAWQRALAIAPDFVMPALPVLDNGVSPGGFCFDVAFGGGGVANAGGAAAAGAPQQRTPSAAGPSTPVLINPLAAGGDEAGGGTETEASPMSKFPDLESPLPADPVPTAAAAPAVVPAAGGSFVEANRSKTPATARRPGGTGVVTAGAAGAATAANARRAASPQRARAPPAFGGGSGAGQRSKTPGRPFGGAATATGAKADAEPNSRIVRKPSTARDSRSRSVANTSPRDLSGGGAAPVSARASSPTEAPDRQAGRRAGPNSVPAPRIAAGGVFRTGTGRRSVLDAVGGAQQPQAAAAAAAVISVAAPAAHDIDVGETVSAGSADASAGKAASPPSFSGGHKSTSPGAASSSLAATAAGGNRAAAPWRAVRSISVSAARTSRAALAAGSSPPQASPTGADVAANGHHQAPGAKRPVSVARGGSTDFATSAAGATAAHAKRASATSATSDGPVAGARRPGAAAEAMASARARNVSPPINRTGALPANAAANAAAAAARRRSQPGTAAAAAGMAAGTEAAASRQPEKRVRRSSYVAYGKPTDSAPLQRRPPSSQAHPSLLTSRDSVPGSAAATAAARAAAAARELGPLSSHPLASSDRALDSFPPSASCSPVGQVAARALERAAQPAAATGTTDAAEPLSSRADAAAAPTGAGEQAEAVMAGTAAAGAGGSAAAGVGHPWRQTPRSRSLMSMTTEDSELSIPDGSRYGPSEPSGGVYDNDAAGAASGGGAASFSVTASPARGVANSIVANAVVQPLWSCNQLYSGSYGSCAGSVSDVPVQAAPPAPSAAAGAVAPAGGAAAAGVAPPMAGATTPLTADLPRRVSASAFAPHLLGSYGRSAAAALAAAGEDVGGTDSEASTPAEGPRGSALMGLRRLTVHEAEEAAGGGVGGGGGGPMQLVSPGRYDLVASSPPAAGAAPESPSPLSSAATSPLSGMYGGGGGAMEIVSPTAPPPRRHAAPAASGGDSPADGQYRRAGGNVIAQQQQQQQLLQQRRSNRALDTRASGGLGGGGTGGGSQSYMLSSRLSADASSMYEASPLGSTVSAVQRGLAAQQRQQQQENSALADEISVTAAAAAPADSCSEVTSHLRPVAEDADGEAESAAPHAAVARGAAAAVATASDLSSSERAQLALLQRVVALAGSLWEMGRDEELGTVLSSTLSRALVRRLGGGATAAATATAATQASQQSAASSDFSPHPSQSLSPSASLRLRQLRAPELGDAVRVTSGPLRGTEAVVRYRGPCHWGAGTVLGLELPHATGQPAGSPNTQESPGYRDGVRYFRCHQPGHGAAFVGVEQVAPVQQESSPLALL